MTRARSARTTRFHNADCLLPLHKCMLSVRPEKVMASLENLLLAHA